MDFVPKSSIDLEVLNVGSCGSEVVHGCCIVFGFCLGEVVRFCCLRRYLFATKIQVLFLTQSVFWKAYVYGPYPRPVLWSLLCASAELYAVECVATQLVKYHQEKWILVGKNNFKSSEEAELCEQVSDSP